MHSAVQTFSYRPLDDSQQQIRILAPVKGLARSKTLAFQCKTVSLVGKARPVYATVSYCWGDPKPCRDIAIDGGVLKVPEGTYQALRSIAAHDKGDFPALWIDAICINQHDKDERARQVAMMAKVYSSGERNLIYLGAEDANTEKAIESIRAFARNIRQMTNCNSGNRRDELEAMVRSFTNHHELSIHDHDDHSFQRNLAGIDRDALLAFFLCAWFRRLWVLQEATLAPQSSCLVGERQRLVVDLKDVVDTAIWVYRDHRRIVPGRLVNFEGVRSAALMWKQSYILQFGSKLPVGRLGEALNHSGDLECYDDRDRIFGILGITCGSGVEVPMLLRPNYHKSREEVYRDAMRFCIEVEGSREVFNRISHRAEDEVLGVAGPTWVPKLWRSPTTRLDAGVFRPYRATRISRPEERVIDPQAARLAPDVLQLKGFVLGQLRALSPIPIRGLSLPKHIGQALFHIASLLPEIDGDFSVAKLLIADMNHMVKRSTQEDVRVLAELVSMAAADETIYVLNRLPTNAPRTARSAAEFLDAMSAAWGNRRFAVTSTGSIGLVPQICRKGDLLILLTAASHPVMLRKCGKEAGEYFILGECYFDGIMYDNEVEQIQRREQEVVFRVR